MPDSPIVDGSRPATAAGAETVTRRDFFRSMKRVAPPAASLSQAAAVVASVWGVAAMSEMRAEAAPRSVSGDVDKNALLAKLVRRVTWGFTQEEYSLAQQLGYDGYLEYHLNAPAIDDSAMDARLVAYTTLTMQQYQLYPLPAGQVVNELSEAMILRATLSKRQLFERLVEFWTDHFNIDILDNQGRYLKTVDDRNVIRAHALGTFPTMLRASAQSPCMLAYLNNDTNIASSPNENYARELMELHTLSVTGPYTQQDVVAVARCLTGWSLFRVAAGTNAGLFQFNSAQHDNGSKTVLGQLIPAGGGLQDGFTVLDILAVHPATASFIATKLTKRFLGEDVAASIIASVTATYLATGGDIKAMMRTILSPNNLFTDSGPRYKRPQHQAISAMRALGTPITSTQSLRQNHFAASGHVPFAWGPPDGYPDYLAHWQGLILPRWNFGASLAINGIGGLTFDVATFFAGLSTATQMVDKINTVLFGGEMLANERAALISYLSVNAADTTRRRDTVGLAIGCPSFQWY